MAFILNFFKLKNKSKNTRNKIWINKCTTFAYSPVKSTRYYSIKSWYGKYVFEGNYKYFLSFIGLFLILLFLWNSIFPGSIQFYLLISSIICIILLIHGAMLIFKFSGFLDGGPPWGNGSAGGNEYDDLLMSLTFIFPFLCMVFIAMIFYIYKDLTLDEKSIFTYKNTGYNCNTVKLFPQFPMRFTSILYSFGTNKLCFINTTDIEMHKIILKPGDKIKPGAKFYRYKYSGLLVPVDENDYLEKQDK